MDPAASPERPARPGTAPYEVRLPAARAGTVSAGFVNLLRKFGASPRLLRELGPVTEAPKAVPEAR